MRVSVCLRVCACLRVSARVCACLRVSARVCVCLRVSAPRHGGRRRRSGAGRCAARRWSPARPTPATPRRATPPATHHELHHCMPQGHHEARHIIGCDATDTARRHSACRRGGMHKAMQYCRRRRWPPTQVPTPPMATYTSADAADGHLHKWPLVSNDRHRQGPHRLPPAAPPEHRWRLEHAMACRTAARSAMLWSVETSQQQISMLHKGRGGRVSAGRGLSLSPSLPPSLPPSPSLSHSAGRAGEAPGRSSPPGRFPARGSCRPEPGPRREGQAREAAPGGVKRALGGRLEGGPRGEQGGRAVSGTRRQTCTWHTR
jgi:hypothetical protein